MGFPGKKPGPITRKDPDPKSQFLKKEGLADPEIILENEPAPGKI